MPCDSIQISEAVPMGKIELPRLKIALEAAGWNVYLDAGNLRATRYTDDATDRISLNQGDTNATIGSNNPVRSIAGVASDVRRAYAAQTVQDMAKKYGWKLTKTENNQLTFKR